LTSNLYFISALLALVGGALSFYFYGVYRDFISYRHWWIPHFCEVDLTTCTSIVDSKYGRILGIPNALTGTVFMLCYAFTLAGVPMGWVTPVLPFYLGIFTMLVAVYLIYGLIRLQVTCPVCIIVHTLNGIIFLIQI
jgi:uncharacterized membrane protein